MSIDLNKLLEIYGLKGFFIGVAVMAMGALFKSEWFNRYWTKFTDKMIDWFLSKKNKPEDVKPIKETDILNHDVFNYVDFWMYSKIPTFQFSTEYRTIIFRKYLTTYLRCYRKGLYDFVKSGNYKQMDRSELWKNLMDLINNIVFDYENQSKELGIPEIVISKMKLKNNDTIQLLIDLIESISNSQFYQSEDNLLKMYSILNIVLSVLENTISNSESICNSINGQLSGLSTHLGDREIKEP